MAEAKVNHGHTILQNKRRSAPIPPPPPPPQSQMTFESVDEISWILLPASQKAGFIKIFEFHPLYQSYWWGRGALHLHLLFWNRVWAKVLSRSANLKEVAILIKHRIRKFIVSTVAIVYKPFREQRIAKKPSKLKNCAWFLKWFWNKTVKTIKFWIQSFI